MFKYKTQDEVVKAALEIMEAKVITGDALTSPTLVKEYLQLRISDEGVETFTVMFLDNKHKIIAIEDVFKGTIDRSHIYPREVVKAALRHNAAACILAHNHPSNDTTPSEADKKITASLREALALIDVSVLDHIIVGRNSTLSFAEQGFL